MEITREWLEEKGACTEGRKWFLRQNKTDAIDVIRALVADNLWDWANWTIVRLMSREQYLSYAIFTAEQVIDIFEARYPDDKRPRQAIEAARVCLQNDTQKNRKAASAAASDANAAASDAYAAASAAYAAAYAAAYTAAYAAAAAASAAYASIKTKIINYGVQLLEGGEKR